MSCTTILVGSQASYDGSCMIARNDDTGAGSYSPKNSSSFCQISSLDTMFLKSVMLKLNCQMIQCVIPQCQALIQARESGLQLELTALEYR